MTETNPPGANPDSQPAPAPNPSPKKKTKTKAAGKPARKQKFTEAELKRLGLDPACYGFVKK